MSGMRRLCREVAANTSYRMTRTTDMFEDIFLQKWRGTAKARARHPEFTGNASPTKRKKWKKKWK